MHSSMDPTMMLGRYSQVTTSAGVVNGTILAVGARGISVAVDRNVIRISPADIRTISTAT